MFDDPIVSETRRVRDAYAASFGYDVGKIVADLQSRQGKDGRQVVDRTVREQAERGDAPEPTAAAFPNGSSTSVAG
jgi:hypothetical protein